MAEEYLKVENLYKNYGNIKAVNNVSFSAKKGEIIAKAITVVVSHSKTEIAE